MKYIAFFVVCSMIFSTAFIFCRIIAVAWWEFTDRYKKKNPRVAEHEEPRNIAGQVMPGDILPEVKRRMRLHDLPAYQLRDGHIEPIDRVTWRSINPN